MDEVAIWKRVLDQPEIDELVAAGPAPPERPEGNYIVNGDFEDTEGWGVPSERPTFPVAWGSTTRKNAATQMTGTGAIGGLGTSAYCESFYATRQRAFAGNSCNTPSWRPSRKWQCDMDFACENPYATATDRSFNVSLQHSNGILSVRVVDSDSNGVGDMEYYDGQSDTAGLDGDSRNWTNSVIFDDNLYVDPATHEP